MKAIFYEGNRNIRVGGCDPISPARDEVRIQVSHCGVCGTDLHIYHGKMDSRVTFPQILGHEMSGVIAEIGNDVQGFHVGDHVVVRPLDPCGKCSACDAGHSHICQNLMFLGIDTPGAFQASWTVPSHTLHLLPDSISKEQGALIEPIAVACHDVRMGDVKTDEFVVVIGGGPIGMLNALVARSKGARVLISEVNDFRLALASDLGFETVNPRENDLVATVEEKTGGAGADVVFEVSGSSGGAEMMTKLVRTRGRIVVVAIFAEPPKIDLFQCFWRELRIIGVRVYEHEDYEEAIRLVSSGNVAFDRLISDVRPFERLKETFEQMTEGGNIMKVLIDCTS